MILEIYIVIEFLRTMFTLHKSIFFKCLDSSQHRLWYFLDNLSSTGKSRIWGICHFSVFFFVSTNCINISLLYFKIIMSFQAASKSLNTWKNSFSSASSFLHFSLFDFYFCTKSKKDPQAWSNVYNRRLQAGCYL